MTTIFPLLGVPTPGFTPQETRTLTVNATRDGVQTPEQKEAVIFSSFYDLTPILYFPLRDGARSSRTVVASALEGKYGLRLFDFTEEPLSVFKEINLTSDIEIILDLSEDGSGGILDYPSLTGIGKLSGYFDLDSLPEDVTYSDITIRAYYIDPEGGRFNGLQAAQVNCQPSGEWLIEGISGHHMYNVVISIPGYNDIIYSNKVTSDDQYLPPGDPHWDNVVALLHFDGNLYKNEAGPDFTTYGTPTLVRGEYGEALFADGTHGVLAQNEDFILGSEDFTIECLWRPIGIDKTAFSFNASGSSAHTIYQFSGGLSFWNGGANIIISNRIVASDRYYHIAFVRFEGTAYLFLEGDLIGSAPYSNVLTNNGVRTGNVTSINTAGGAIDEFRITKGVARYTENFTPSVKPFPNHYGLW